MITAIVTFALPQPITQQEAQKIFLSTAPRYQNLPGLLRKYYVLSEDGRTAGGVYLWQSREAAQAQYDSAWCAFVREKYGSEPQLTYLHTPVVVDNLTHEIVSAA